MSLVRTSWAEVRAAVVARLGRTRKMGSCDWTPWPNVDDCSYFCSSMLFGGKPGPIGWVDNWKLAKFGTYHSGWQGMRAGDVVLFDWEKNGVGNHVEFCDRAPGSGGGVFATLGANGSDTIAVKARTRDTYWVMGYFRPAYGAISGAGSKPAKPIVVAPTVPKLFEENIDMSTGAFIVSKTSTAATQKGAVVKGYVYLIDFAEKTILRVSSAKQVALLKRIAPVVKVSTKGVPSRQFPPILGDTVKNLVSKEGFKSLTPGQ